MKPPPFLISFPDKGTLMRALPDALEPSSRADLERLIDDRLPPLLSRRVVALLFGFNPSFVGALNQNPERYYRKFTIHSGDKLRTIHAPHVALKIIQKWFGHYLSERVTFGDSTYGFVPRKSAAMAAAVHCSADWIYSFDIKAFFETTSIAKVASALSDLGYPQGSAGLASRLCCHSGNLAQGSPASPVLSNLVFKSTDARLDALALEHSMKYTRYADDMVFSGQGEPPSNFIATVQSIIEASGWKLADRKTHLSIRPNRLKVFGLLVNNRRPRLTKMYRNKIRAIRHLLTNDRILPDMLAQAKGHISYADSICNLPSAHQP